MPTSPAYSAGRFMLELEGKAAGFLASVEGGEAFAEVVNEPAGTAQSELVARRLLTTVQPVASAPTASKREVGTSIGARWASERATLEEPAHS